MCDGRQRGSARDPRERGRTKIAPVDDLVGNESYADLFRILSAIKRYKPLGIRYRSAILYCTEGRRKKASSPTSESESEKKSPARGLLSLVFVMRLVGLAHVSRQMAFTVASFFRLSAPRPFLPRAAIKTKPKISAYTYRSVF